MLHVYSRDLFDFNEFSLILDRDYPLLWTSFSVFRLFQWHLQHRLPVQANFKFYLQTYVKYLSSNIFFNYHQFSGHITINTIDQYGKSYSIHSSNINTEWNIHSTTSVKWYHDNTVHKYRTS